MALNTKRLRHEEEEDVDEEENTDLSKNPMSEVRKDGGESGRRGGGWWLPHANVRPTDSWNETAVQLATRVLETRPDENEEEEEFEVTPQLFHVKRCFFPMNISQATVVTFLVTVAYIPTRLSVDPNKRWFSSDDVFEMALNEDGSDSILGSEPLQFFVKLHEGKMLADVHEVFWDKKMGTDPDDNEEPVKKKRLSAVSKLLRSANYGMQQREQFYVAFMLKVFPRTEMCRTVFKREMEAIGWSKETTSSLFLAFDQKQCNFITFRDFMMGSAVTEYCTEHGGPPAEIRCRYIFRYYNTEGDGKMKFNDFRRMVSDIRMLKDAPPKDDDALDVAAKVDYLLFSKTPTENLPLPDFLLTVGKLRFRGTSSLLRFDNLLRSFVATTNLSTSLTIEENGMSKVTKTSELELFENN